jgi:osmoprotectant transport system permease protein
MMTEKLLAGAIPVTIMALVADFFCGLLELLLVSKGLRLNA